MTFDGMPQIATAMKWNPKGDRLSVVIKGGGMYNYDPRAPGVVQQGNSHTGPKAIKLAWVDDNFFLTSGFNKQAVREFAFWDSRDLSQAISRGPLGEGLGVGHLYFDEQHNLLYTAGRGEMQIGIFSFDRAQANPLTFITNYVGPTPQKGANIMPKQCLNVDNHEVDRFVRMSNNGSIEYISFKLPNRTGQFQEDLYPPFESNTAASTYSEWASGQDKPAVMIQLKPGMDLNANKKANQNSVFKPKSIQSTPVASSSNQNADDGQKDAQIASLI